MLTAITSMITSPRVLLLIRILLGAVFIWAGIPKITDPQGFASIVANYQVLPSVLVNPVAVVLPWIEVLCGVALITGRLLGGAASIFVALMSVFLLLTAFNLYRGLDISCGCFSTAADKDPGSKIFHLLGDAVMLILGLVVLRRSGTAGQARVAN